MTNDRQAPPVFHMPAALAASGYTIRTETEQDVAFLEALYASTRADELAQATGLSAEQKQGFLAQQFAAQRTHYRTHFVDCAFAVVEQGGVAVGRLYLERRGAFLHIVDIALLSQVRGHGVGSALLDGIIAMAEEEGLGVSLFVERFNPVLRLYRRLGFTERDDRGVYLEMVRDVAQGATPTPLS